MKYFDFEKKQPLIGEEIFIIQQLSKGSNVFIATYLGRENIDIFGTSVIKLDNFKKYSNKSYLNQHNKFMSVNLHWARLY